MSLLLLPAQTSHEQPSEILENQDHATEEKVRHSHRKEATGKERQNGKRRRLIAAVAAAAIGLSAGFSGAIALRVGQADSRADTMIATSTPNVGNSSEQKPTDRIGDMASSLAEEALTVFDSALAHHEAFLRSSPGDHRSLTFTIPGVQGSETTVRITSSTTQSGPIEIGQIAQPSTKPGALKQLIITQAEPNSPTTKVAFTEDNGIWESSYQIGGSETGQRSTLQESNGSYQLDVAKRGSRPVIETPVSDQDARNYLVKLDRYTRSSLQIARSDVEFAAALPQRSSTLPNIG